MVVEQWRQTDERIAAHGHRGGAVNTHQDTVCAGQPCCIHNPSAHHMATWPQLWRHDRYLMERTCPHGIGHPDPDHMRYVSLVAPDSADGQGVHGCDGCCWPTPAPPQTTT